MQYMAMPTARVPSWPDAALSWTVGVNSGTCFPFPLFSDAPMSEIGYCSLEILAV